MEDIRAFLPLTYIDGFLRTILKGGHSFSIVFPEYNNLELLMLAPPDCIDHVYVAPDTLGAVNVTVPVPDIFGSPSIPT